MMKRLCSCFAQLHEDESGQGLVEYVLVVALLVFTAVAMMTNVAGDISSVFSKVHSTLTSVLAIT